MPRMTKALINRLFADVVQPDVPFRRHLAGFRPALIYDSATLAVVTVARAASVIAVTVVVGADEFARYKRL